ncbi:hypothetical protein ABWG36_005533, partial [Escherichia coli]
MANNQNDLFNQFNPMTTTASSDLFAAPKDTTRDIYRQPSRYELQQRAAAQNEAVYNAALRDFQAVMETPEWQNASLERRQEIYDDIKETQYQKFLSQYQDNEDLYYKLQMIPELTLGADISSLKKQIDDANELADTWRGMQTSAHQVATGLGDSVPMAVIKWQRDRLAGRTDAYAQRRIAELDEELARQVAEQAETLAKVKALDAQKSIARRNTELRREELQGENGEFLGSVGWALESPQDALSLAVEQTPTMVPVAAASAGGFLVGGLPGAGAAGTAMGSLLSGGDAAGGASMDLLQRPMEEFQKMPEFQELIKQGVPAETARNLIIAGAAGSAGRTGAAIGAATGALGPGGMVGRTAGRLLTGTAARSAANSTITGAIGKGALKAAGGAGVEGVEEGATQWASNTGVNTATGLNEDVWEGVGEAAALGMIAGGPMSTVSSTVDTVQGIRAARAEKKAKAARGETDTTTHSDVVSPAEAVAAVSGDMSQASAPTTSEDSNKLRQALTAYRDKLYETPGIPLTVEERNSLYDVAYAATKAGVSESAVNSMLEKVAIKRATPDNVSLPDGFKAYAAARDAQTSTTPATATATATSTTTVSAATTPTRPSWAGAESMEHVAPLAQAMMSAYKRDSVVPQATYTPMQREPFDATVRSLPRTPRGLRVNTPETVYVRPDGKASASLSKLQGKGNG